LHAGIEDQLEAELITVEAKGKLQIANVDGNGLQAEIRVAPIKADRGGVEGLARRNGHGRHYTARGGVFVETKGEKGEIG
jgi:hypothetical protein